MFSLPTLSTASIDALVAISATIAPGLHDRDISDHYADLYDARESLKTALGLPVLRGEDASPMALIDILARRLQLDPATRDLGDRIQQIIRPAISAPLMQAAE